MWRVAAKADAIGIARYSKAETMAVALAALLPNFLKRASGTGISLLFDPELAVNDVQSMDARIAGSLMARRSPALLAAIFSGIALLPIGIGVDGVLSYGGGVAPSRNWGADGVRRDAGADSQAMLFARVTLNRRRHGTGSGRGVADGPSNACRAFSCARE